MNKIFAVIVLLLASGALTAQEQAHSVVVNKDPRVDLLVDKQIQINEATTRDSRRFAPGFRILVISSSNRNDVTDAKTTMYREFPELKAYLMYQAPFFRLKVGNFKGRSDAEAYISLVQKLFRKGVYVVPDTIEVRPELDN